jgi:AcrR family transcriptional regulator
MSSALSELLVQALTASESDPDGTEDRILTAALAEFADAGMEGATMDDIAARAGVGRMTVFRKFGSKQQLIEQVLIRELRRFLLDVDARLNAVQGVEERVAEAFVCCVRAGTQHPLLSRMVEREPGAIFERLSAGAPSPLELGRAYVAARIRVDGVPVEDADTAADLLVRLAITYVLMPGSLEDMDSEQALRDFARRVLAPLVS